MNPAAFRRVVIVGGGTAGWMAAAAIGAAFGGLGYDIALVESEGIGTIGVGEATVPPIREFLRLLRIDEREFLNATDATFKYGIEFENWNGVGRRFFHPFGRFGPDINGISFHNFWLRYRAEGGAADPWQFHVEAQAAAAGRFARSAPEGSLSYAYHFDAQLFARLLRARATVAGVARVEGEVVDTEIDGETGDLRAIVLRSGQRIEGDLFVDCSGFRALLIGAAMGEHFIDWSHWLPCDRAVAVHAPIEQRSVVPYTRSIAEAAGWRWLIPLRHHVGNGYVYSSSFIDDAEAAEVVQRGSGAAAATAINGLKFTAGRRAHAWTRNVVAIGLAAGFLEPLESTSIHLIQTGIIRLLGSFPRDRITASVVERYNRDNSIEYERARDFIIAHYALSAGPETPFWAAVRANSLPGSLVGRIEAFRAAGAILCDPGEFFETTSWFAILNGMGIESCSHHPLADNLSIADLHLRLMKMRRDIASTVAALPGYGVELGQSFQNRIS